MTAVGNGSSGVQRRSQEILQELLRKLEHRESVDIEALKEQYPAFRDRIQALVDGFEWVDPLDPTADLHGPLQGVGSPTVNRSQPRSYLGDFELIREVGRGGMGVVYEARQVSLNKRVALKILPLAGTLDQRVLLRFQNEARAAAQLEHPNIVPVHAVGSDRGVHYYAMQFIDGSNLARLISSLKQISRHHSSTAATAQPSSTSADSKSPSQSESETVASRDFVHALSTKRSTSSPEFLRSFVRLAIQIADALEHAHSLGVVHRDIKPANLLLDPQGDAWLTDFGLAQVQGDPGLTLTGDVVGTLRYMSPEQAYAKRVVVDHRTDIYSFGVTLYELLTLVPAIGGKSRTEILTKIAFEDPTPLRKVDRRIPMELETIIMKALAKNPDERYQTAGLLAADLRRFQRDEPILARRPTFPQRAAKWSRRHRPLVVSAAIIAGVVFLATIATSLVTLDAYGKVRVAFAKEQEQKKEALDGWQRSEGLRLVANSSLQLPQDPALALGLAVRGAELQPGLEANNAILAALDALHEEHTLTDHPGPVGHASFSADGDLVVTTGHHSRFGNKVPEPARIWNAATGELVKTLEDQTTVTSAIFSPRGGRLLTASSPQPLLAGDDLETGPKGRPPVVWDWSTGNKTVLEGAFLWQAHARCFSPSGELVVVPALGHAALIWDVVEGQPRQRLEGHTRRVIYAAFVPGGDKIVTFSDDNTVRSWNLKGEELLRWDWWANEAPEATRCVIDSVAFSPDGSRLVTTSRKYGVHVWDAQSGARISETHISGSYAEFSPDGERLVVVLFDSLEVYDARTLEKLQRIEAKTGTVQGIALSADGLSVAIRAINQPMISVWSLQTGERICELRGHQGELNAMAFGPDRRLVSASADQTARIWNVQSGAERRRLAKQAHLEPEPLVAFSQDTQRLLAATQPEPVIQSWAFTDLAAPRSIFPGTMTLPQDIGARIITTVENKAAVIELESGREIAAFPLHQGNRTPAILSPNGRDAVLTVQGNLWLWDVEANQRHRLSEAESATFASFDPTGERVAVRGSDGVVRIYDVQRRAVLFTLPHEGVVVSQRFSPTGDRLLTVSDQNKAYVWNLTDGERVVVMGKPDTIFNRAEFNHDASQVVTYRTSKCSEVISWNIVANEIVKRLGFETPAMIHVSTHPSRNQAAIVSDLGGVALWNTETGASQVCTTAAASVGEFAPDGQLLVTAHPRQPRSPGELPAAEAKLYGTPSVRIWNPETAELVQEVPTGDGTGNDLAVSRDGSAFFVVADRYGVSVNDPATRSELISFPVHAAPLSFAAFTPDRLQVVTASWDRTAAVWQAETGTMIHRLSGHGAAISAAALSPDGTQLATADAQGAVRLWDIATGTLLRELEGHTDTVLFTDWSADGQLLLTGSLDRTIRITNVTDGQVVVLQSAPNESPRWAEFAPNGKGILTIPDGQPEFRRDKFGTGVYIPRLEQYHVDVYETLGAAPVRIPQEQQLLSATFAKQGEQVMLLSFGGEAELWDRGTRATIQRLAAGRNARSAYPDQVGSRALTIADRRVSLWDTTTGTELMTLNSNTGFRSSPRVQWFSPDSRWLLSLDIKGYVSILPTDPLSAAKSRRPRLLTDTEESRFQVDLMATIRKGPETGSSKVDF